MQKMFTYTALATRRFLVNRNYDFIALMWLLDVGNIIQIPCYLLKYFLKKLAETTKENQPKANKTEAFASTVILKTKCNQKYVQSVYDSTGSLLLN